VKIEAYKGEAPPEVSDFVQDKDILNPLLDDKHIDGEISIMDWHPPEPVTASEGAGHEFHGNQHTGGIGGGGKDESGVTRSPVTGEVLQIDRREAGGFIPASRADVAQTEYKAMIAQGIPEADARHFSAESADKFDVRGTATGQVLRFDNSLALNETEKDNVCKAVGAMIDKYPERPLNVTVVPQSTMEATGHPTAWGLTPTGSAASFAISQNAAISFLAVPEQDKAAAAGWFMPTGADHTSIEYVAAHEYGHTIDNEQKGGNTPYPVRPMAVDNVLDSVVETTATTGIAPPVSGYSKVSDNELYAEMFAEYTLSGGTTANPIAQELAKAAGWR
jgi:hypothetical protein